MSSLVAIKASAKARESEERQKQERRRNLMVLILSFLRDQGYFDSQEKLESECQVSLSKLDVADNIDLLTVLQEFEEHFDMKFGKKPKLVRKLGEEEHSAAVRAALPGIKSASRRPGVHPRGVAGPGERNDESGASRSAGQGNSAAVPRCASGAGPGRRQRPISARGDGPEPNPASGASCAGRGVDAGRAGLEIGVSATAMVPLERRAGKESALASATDDNDPNAFFERRVLKPLPDFGSSELRELGAAIQRDIYLDNPNVRWEAIAGLRDAKKLLKEAVVMPHKYPQFFTGLLSPWKGVLLYGPPGTGKTMLARAVATECKTTFFNISASSVVSKWRGDSEKLVRVLFELARYHAPSTIFMDEIDSIMGSRDGAGEHEASRRMKTELLIQMDGLAKSPDMVFVLAATNLPWELDMAMLRRLEKRILVPLPDVEARAAIFSALLHPHRQDGDVSAGVLAEMTEGYSGADAMLLAKEMAMRPLRRLMMQIEDEDGNTNPSACMEMDPISIDDMHASLAASKPSARLYAAKYTKWSDEYGSV